MEAVEEKVQSATIPDETDKVPVQQQPSEVVEEKAPSENSEYDSAGSYSDEEEGDRGVVKARSRASDLGSHSDTEGSLILEREEGDGQESAPSKKVDDDEDKKNPQYIPKRGTFYEHDDRTADDIENAEKVEEEVQEKDGKKKVWQEKKERWSHDRFNDSEQAPKSRAELVSIYGYDIRNEDGPPRARRRRRYGRGPNKYTRNWEDEDAYNKAPVANVRPKKTQKPRRNHEEFPPLGGGNNASKSPSKSDDYERVDKENEFNQRRSSERSHNPAEITANASQPQPDNGGAHVVAESSNKNMQQRANAARPTKPKKEIKDSDYRGFTTKTRQQRNIKSEQQKILPPRKKEKDLTQSQNFSNKNSVQQMEEGMRELNVQDGVYKGGKNNQNRQGSVPPRLQSEQKGSKRYSSIRQRSLPESTTPPTSGYQPASFYPNDYNSTAPPPATQTPIMQAATIPPTLPPTLPLAQPQFAPPPFPQPPAAFLQAGVAPTPAFIPAQTPQIINYVQSQPTYPPNYQGYQQQFNPVTQPAELYQPQGGITYYSTDQQVVQRLAPQKRPKAAIPIVAPADIHGKDGVRLQDGSTLISSECNTQESGDLQE